MAKKKTLRDAAIEVLKDQAADVAGILQDSVCLLEMVDPEDHSRPLVNSALVECERTFR